METILHFRFYDQSNRLTTMPAYLIWSSEHGVFCHEIAFDNSSLIHWYAWLLCNQNTHTLKNNELILDIEDKLNFISWFSKWFEEKRIIKFYYTIFGFSMNLRQIFSFACNSNLTFHQTLAIYAYITAVM